MDAVVVNTFADDSSPGRAGYRRSAGSPRGEARRRELLDRVTDDLAVNGLVDFSLRRAARAAGTTHKVLLYHFDGVDDLLRQAILQLRERRIGNALAAIAQGPEGQTLAARVRAVWPALVGEESRVLDQAIGLMMYDTARYAELGRGESGGQPRQVQRIREQLADWQAAIAYAPTLPGVDQARLAIWGFSASGGHVFRVAARNPELAAAIAQTPNADGQAAARNAARHQQPLALLRFTGRAALDAVGGLVGRSPRLVPLAAEPGTIALLTTPDALDGGRALNPDNRYPDWQQAVAARSALRLGFYRPGRYASRVRCPILVLACDQDQSALAAPAIRAANRALRGELVRLPGGHYAPFLDAHEQAIEAELSFLRRHLPDHSQADRPGPATAHSARQ